MWDIVTSVVNLCFRSSMIMNVTDTSETGPYPAHTFEGFQAELIGLSLDLSGFLVDLRRFQPGYLTCTRRFNT